MALASQVQSGSMQLNMEENTFPLCVPLASAAIFISTSVNIIAQSLSGTAFASKVTKATNGHLLNAPSLSLPIFLLRPSSRQEAQSYLCPEAHLQFSQVFPLLQTPLSEVPLGGRRLFSSTTAHPHAAPQLGEVMQHGRLCGSCTEQLEKMTRLMGCRLMS